MATQGLVSILDSDGNVVIKAVAGCNGYRARELAKTIREKQLDTVEGIRDAASNVGFGCCDCLVVYDDEDTAYGDLYQETFSDHTFNPRWKHGTADYVEVVQL